MTERPTESPLLPDLADVPEDNTAEPGDAGTDHRGIAPADEVG